MTPMGVGLKATGQEQLEMSLGRLCIGHLDLLSRAFEAVAETKKPAPKERAAKAYCIGAGGPRFQ